MLKLLRIYSQLLILCCGVFFLSVSGLFFFGLFAGISKLPGLAQVGSSFVFTAVGGFFVFIGLAVTKLIILRKNREWLLCLPISRFQIYIFPILIDFIFSIFLLLGLLAPFIVLSQSQNDSGVLVAVGEKLLHYILGAPIELLLCFWSYFILYLASPLIVFGSWGKIHQGLGKAQWVPSLIACVLFFIASAFKLAPIFIFTFLFAIMLSALATQIYKGFLLSPRSWKFLLSVSILSTIGIFLFTLQMERLKLRSDSLAKNTEALSFLGPLADQNFETLKHRYLETDADITSLQTFESYYKNSVIKNDNRPLMEGIDFKLALWSKSSYGTVWNIYHLFSEQTALPWEKLQLFVEKAKTFGDATCRDLAVDLTQDPLPENLAHRFLDSEDPYSICIGVVLARYLMPAQLPVQFTLDKITAGFERLSDYSKLHAIVTLSLLEGRKVTFNELGKQVYGLSRLPASIVSRDVAKDQECSDPKEPLRLDTAEMLVNRCLRFKIPAKDRNDKLLLEFAHQGWIAFPVNDPRAKVMIAKYFPKLQIR